MKHLGKILFSAVFLCVLCLCCTLFAAAETTVTVDSASGLKSAFTTLSSTGGRVTLTGNISITSVLSLPANAEKITLDGGGHTITMSANLAFNGDVDVDNIVFTPTKTYRAIFCNGNTVHFGSKITCNAYEDNYPSIMAGFAGSTPFIGGSLTVDSGTWQRIRGGNAGTSSALQCADVVINGGSVTEFLQIGGAGIMAAGSEINVTVNGGRIANTRFFSTAGTATADTTLTVNGGVIGGTIRMSILGGTLNGDCKIRLAGGDYSGCTGIYGHTGDGNLKVNLVLSETLAKTVYQNIIIDSANGTKIRTSAADPCLVFCEGNYYLTMTGSSNIALIKSPTLDGLASPLLNDNLVYQSASDTTAINTFGYTEVNGTWSPELHYFSADDFGADYAGWYMYLALRKKGDDSSAIRMVTLKSAGGTTPDGPYVHPTTGTTYASQPILDQNGEIITEWGCGETILRVPSGEYKGVYAMWVAEENRGTSSFRQKIMIAKLKSPWQIETEPRAILYPTQYWETIGSGWTGEKYMPKVVEGAAPIYGKNGEIFLIYCGDGYWSNYGLGQLTWNGGDPTLESSWVKYANNPVFGANDANGNHYTGVPMQGAGHAFFIRDAADNLFAVYHAYPADVYGNKSGAGRNAYIEPCYIDYSLSNGVGYGVLRFTNGAMPASTSTAVNFTKRSASSALLDMLDADSFTAEVTIDSTASLTASGSGGQILLTASYSNGASGCEIRKKDAASGNFVLLADLTNGTTGYADSDIEPNTDYEYLAVPYVDYNGTRYYGTASDTVTAQFAFAAPTFSITLSTNSSLILLLLSHTETVDGYRIYKYDATVGDSSKVMLAEIQSSSYFDSGIQTEHTYVYTVTAVINGLESAPAEEKTVYIPLPRLTLTAKTAVGGGITLTVTDRESADSYEFYRMTDNKLIASTADKTITDTDVVPGVLYEYWVSVKDGDQVIASASTTCIAAETKPTLKISVTGNDVIIDIARTSGAAFYNLYQNGEQILSGSLTQAVSYDCTLEDGRYTFRLDVLDEDGNVFDSVSKTLHIGAVYDAEYDTNGDGVCDIADVLLLLRQVLNGSGNTLKDVLRALRFISA